MPDMIDFNAERDKRFGPDPEFVKRDDFGRKMFLFALEYEMGGDSWGAEVWAYDHEDAQRRVEAMRASLKVLGMMYRMAPA